MSVPWTLLVYERQQLVRRIEATGPAELGRQRSEEEEIDSCRPEGDSWRMVIAERETKTVPRRFLRVEPREGGSFELTNLSDSLPVELDDGRRLAPASRCLIDSNVLIAAGERRLRLQPGGPKPRIEGLDESTAPPGEGVLQPPPFTRRPLGPTATVELASVLRWLQSAMDVLQSAATSGDFFARAARALVAVVCLDSGLVLLRLPGDWEVRA
jgi:hypothetical protein